MTRTPTPTPSTATLLSALVRRTGMLALPAAMALATSAPVAHAANRTWIGGNDNWDGVASGKWNPVDEPDADDTAIFNTPNIVDMTIDNDILELILSGGIDLNVLDQNLTVSEDVTLSGGGTVLGVGGAGIAGLPTTGLQADNITINSGADLLAGGNRITFNATVGTGVLTNNTGGIIGGFGEIRNGDGLGSVETVFINNGRISPSTYNPEGNLVFTGTARTLTFTAQDADARFNLDGTGSENGEVFINRNETVDINVQLSDFFSGTLSMNEDAVLDIEDNWGLNGTFNVDNDGGGTILFPAGTAFIRGGQMTHSTGATTTVQNAGSTLQFDSVFLGSGGTLDNTAGGTVIFNNTATFNNGFEYQGGGNGQLIVDGNSTLTVNDDDFDMDGTGGADLTIRNGSVVNIRGDNFDGGSATQVFGGTLIFQDDDNSTATGGDQIFDFDLTANNQTIELRGVRAESGTARIRSQAGDNVVMGGTVVILPDARLVLDAQSTTFSGSGSVSGANGRLFFDEVVGFDDDTTVTVQTLDIDNGNGSLIVNPGATLDLNAGSIDRIFSAFIINAGVADVSTVAYDVGNGGVMNFLSSGGTGAVTPTYTGAGTVSFESGSELNNFRAGLANFDSDARFEEGSDIINRTATSILQLGAFGETIELNGGDISETVAGSTVRGGGTWLVTGNTDVDVTTFDWDQATTTRIATGGTLDVNVGTIDSSDDQHDSTIDFTGGTLTVNNTANNWISDSLIRSTSGGNITGDRLDIGNDTGAGDANVDVNGGVLSISAVTDYNADADVDIAAGSTLRHTNAVDFNSRNGTLDAEFTGAGTLQLAGTNDFNEVTTINMVGGTVDLDNSNIISLTAFDTNINASTTINAATFQPYGSTKFFGPTATQAEINIADTARLTVNIDGDGEWRVLSNGIINYAGNTSLSSFLAGDRLDLDGTLNVTGDGQALNEMEIGGTINILTANERFLLAATNNEINGGTVSGAGLFAAGSGDRLTGFGTLNTAIDFEGLSELIATGGVLEVNGSILDVGTLRAVDGTLQIDSALASSVTSNGISLSNGVLQGGGTITLNDRNLRGNGTVTSRLRNNNTIRAEGGTLVINNASTDVDGIAPENGTLQANAGATLELRNFQDFENFNGTVFANGGLVFTNGEDLRFAADSTTTLSNGVFRTNIDTVHQGDLTAGGTSTLQAINGSRITFGSDSDIDAVNTLQLDGNFRVSAGSVVSGSGSINLLPGELVLDDGAVISTLFNNQEGALELGLGTGRAQATIQDFQQSGDGSLGIDIAGTGLNDFDRLSIAGSAILGGDLLVQFLFAESVGDTFTIMTGLNISDTFDTVQTIGLDAGLGLDVIYNPTSVVLEVVNAVALGIVGDYDDSGQVEQGDLNLVLNNWGGPAPFTPNGAPFATPNVDQEELNRVLNNWGNTAAPPSFEGFSVPEPGAAAVALALAGLSLRRRRMA